jgi:zinc transporter ZupT
MYFAPLFVSLILIFFHFFGEVISKHIERFHLGLISFGAGLVVATFFLEILPEISFSEVFLGRFIYLIFLIGFILIHIVEKFVYKEISIKKIEPERTKFEAAGYVALQLLSGLIVAIFFEAYGELAYIILVPFYVRAFAISVSSSHIYEKINNKFNRLFKITSPVIGTLCGLFLIQNRTQLYSVFSFTMGLVLYIVVRDMIPRGKKGKPVFFILGSVISITMFLLF